MTAITQTSEHCFKINGRLATSFKIKSLCKVGSGRWEGETRNGAKIAIEGGRAAGGSSTDWFLDYEAISLKCNSAREAFELVESL